MIHADSKIRISALVLLTSLVLAGPASAWLVRGGWTGSDVGLNDDGEAWYAGLGRTIPWGHEVFDADWALEFVQKKGSQPTAFSDPVAGFTEDDAEVTLSYVQTSAFIGAHHRMGNWVPRLFLGFSFALKVDESWSEFPGTPSTEYAYQDIDFVGNLGFSLRFRQVLAEVRFAQGFTSQLIEDSTFRTGDKATDPMPGVDEPEIGAKLQTWQVGLGLQF